MADNDNANTNWWGPPLTPRTFREVSWTLRAPPGSPVTCVIELGAANGYEVRAEYSDDAVQGLVETRWEPTLAPARIFAHRLRARLLRNGGFVEVNPTSEANEASRIEK